AEEGAGEAGRRRLPPTPWAWVRAGRARGARARPDEQGRARGGRRHHARAGPVPAGVRWCPPRGPRPRHRGRRREPHALSVRPRAVTPTTGGFRNTLVPIPHGCQAWLRVVEVEVS